MKGSTARGSAGSRVSTTSSPTSATSSKTSSGLPAPTTRTRSAVRQGAHLRYDLQISFMDAVKGTSTQIELEKLERCQECQGRERQSGDPPEMCNRCAGRGTVTQSSGFFTISTTCPHCRGAGRANVKNPCKPATGPGRPRRERPSASGSPWASRRVPACGCAAKARKVISEAPSGDLYVFIHVEPHEFFERDGFDVLCQIPISVTQAALGHDRSADHRQQGILTKSPRDTERQDLPPEGKASLTSRASAAGTRLLMLLSKFPPISPRSRRSF